MRAELHAVRDSARRFHQVATEKRDLYPKALTPSGIDGAWRVTIHLHPELGPFKEQFVRIAKGEE